LQSIDRKQGLMAEPGDCGRPFLPDQATPDNGEPHVTHPG